jgi:hypothetical protein
MTDLPIDPELHTLRSVLNAIDDPSAETARFKLFKALEAEDYALARRWHDALEAAVRSAFIDITRAEDEETNRGQLAARAYDALTAIYRYVDAAERATILYSAGRVPSGPTPDTASGVGTGQVAE